MTPLPPLLILHVIHLDYSIPKENKIAVFDSRLGYDFVYLYFLRKIKYFSTVTPALQQFSYDSQNPKIIQFFNHA